jgi:hypothetical protein
METNMKMPIAPAAVALLLSACGGSSNPAQPTLGTIIDRMGRPAVNTAVTNPFELVSGKTNDQAKDDYNANNDPTTWVASFAPQFAKSLAVLDGLDRNCGNQLIAKPLASGAVPADRYMPLAGVLADDQLYVRTDKTTCALYLAVEADAVQLTSGNNDCGGRTPLENAVDETYSLFAVGAPSGVTNGITSDSEHTASLTDFPFLQAPN